MTPSEMIVALFGAIGTLSGAVGFLYSQIRAIHKEQLEELDKELTAMRADRDYYRDRAERLSSAANEAITIASKRAIEKVER